MIRFIVFVFLMLACAAAYFSQYGIALLAAGYAVFCFYAERQLDQRDREWLARPGSARVRDLPTESALEKQSTEASADKL